jgi:phosphatidylserine decarboxylase
MPKPYPFAWLEGKMWVSGSSTFCRLAPAKHFSMPDAAKITSASQSSALSRLNVEPLPDNLRSVQPGGGVCYQLELAWGRVRRGWLKRIFPGYVKRMAELRQGSAAGAPHEILDPRDLKFCRNRVECDWRAEDDPFRWRGKLGFARWGLAELQLMGWPLAVAMFLALIWLPGAWKAVAVVPGIVLALVVWFFRDPPRRIPAEPGLVVSPADGKIVEISPLPHDDFVGGPAVRIGIFLSIFNVHINRAPTQARVIKLHYSPGEFLNAMNPESAMRNENLWIGLEEEQPPHRRLTVRQIAGLIARRIVCDLRPGEVIDRGHKFGMIKLGSRTELVLSAEGVQVICKRGDTVRGGSTILARYAAKSSLETNGSAS